MFVGITHRSKASSIPGECLESLYRSLRYPLDIALLCCDDGAHAKLPELENGHVAKHILISLPGLTKVSSNWNALVALALDLGHEIIGIWNDDVIVPNVDWQAIIESFFRENPSYGVVSPDTYVYAKSDLPSPRENFLGLRDFSYRPRDVVPGIHGCFFFARRQVFEQVGRFDTDFTCMWEEAEWLFRVHRAGWRSGVLGNLSFFHYGSKTLTEMSHEWRSAQYRLGKELFHQKTGAPVVGDWNFHHGIYHCDGKAWV